MREQEGGGPSEIFYEIKIDDKIIFKILFCLAFVSHNSYNYPRYSDKRRRTQQYFSPRDHRRFHKGDLLGIDSQQQDD